jgi:hypothetical protein
MQLYLGDLIVLRTLNYKNLKTEYKVPIMIDICTGTYEMISTDASNANYHRFYSDIDFIEFSMPRNMERSVIQSSPNILFRNVYHLVVNLSSMESSIISFFKNLFVSSE